MCYASNSPSVRLWRSVMDENWDFLSPRKAVVAHQFRHPNRSTGRYDAPVCDACRLIRLIMSFSSMPPVR